MKSPYSLLCGLWFGVFLASADQADSRWGRLANPGFEGQRIKATLFFVGQASDGTSGREAWKFFRELAQPKWTEAFHQVIKNVTGETEVTYVTAVTWFKGRRELWEEKAETRAALRGNPIRLLAVKDILTFIESTLTGTPAASDVGRLVQLIKAANKT